MRFTTIFYFPNHNKKAVKHRGRCVKSLFTWSHEEGYILKNLTAKLKEPKLGKRIPKFLSELEIEHLREACQTTMEKALFEFLYSTGCHIGKIVKFPREDINKIMDYNGSH